VGTAKQEFYDVLDQLPEEALLDDVLESIRFKARLLKSKEQADRGEGVPHEQVMDRLEQWLQSLGHAPRSQTSTR
jgi:hypothetical protein